MSWIPKPQEIYRHFKGNLYQIVTIAQDSEDGRAMVVYQALYGSFQVYVRPLEMFIGKVDKVKYPDASQEYRFEQVVMPESCQPEKHCEKHRDYVPELTHEPEKTSEAPTHISEKQETTLDPLIWEFLDADSHEKRLNILAALHHRITDDMITTMAVACDVEVPEGDVEERYSQLKNCLTMLDRFEIKRKY